MRRKDRAVTDRKELEQIIDSADVCRLAFNTGEAPYIIPLNYGYSWDSELKLYFHGASEGRKLDLIDSDPRVGFEMDLDHELITGPAACDWSMKYASVTGFGTITEITDRDEKITALNLLMNHYNFPGHPSYVDAMLKAIKVLCLTVEQITGKARH